MILKIIRDPVLGVSPEVRAFLRTYVLTHPQFSSPISQFLFDELPLRRIAVKVEWTSCPSPLITDRMSLRNMAFAPSVDSSSAARTHRRRAPPLICTPPGFFTNVDVGLVAEQPFYLTHVLVSLPPSSDDVLGQCRPHAFAIYASDSSLASSVELLEQNQAQDWQGYVDAVAASESMKPLFVQEIRPQENEFELVLILLIDLLLSINLTYLIIVLIFSWSIFVLNCVCPSCFYFRHYLTQSCAPTSL